MNSRFNLIVISGSTGSGKTQVAIDLHRHLLQYEINSEIIAADSITHYRGFSIGSAKPEPHILKEIPHHLIDICNPEEEFTAGDFVRHAETCINMIHKKNSLPILVGGSGFYLKALLKGMASTRNENKELKQFIRIKLEKEVKQDGIESLYKKMIGLDPILEKKIHPNDSYRIIRALEAMELNQNSWSELNRIAEARKSPYHPIAYFCLNLPREILREKILQRSQKMLADGLLDEVKSLLAKGVSPSVKPFQSIGYKQCIDFLNLSEKENSKNYSLNDLVQAISQATMKLAKSQNTWLRSQAKEVIWVNALEDPLKQILEYLAPEK